MQQKLSEHVTHGAWDLKQQSMWSRALKISFHVTYRLQRRCHYAFNEVPNQLMNTYEPVVIV